MAANDENSTLRAAIDASSQATAHHFVMVVGPLNAISDGESVAVQWTVIFTANITPRIICSETNNIAP